MEFFLNALHHKIIFELINHSWYFVQLLKIGTSIVQQPNYNTNKVLLKSEEYLYFMRWLKLKKYKVYEITDNK